MKDRQWLALNLLESMIAQVELGVRICSRLPFTIISTAKWFSARYCGVHVGLASRCGRVYAEVFLKEL